ncbi:unnamed protein product [Spirodela intermedia]|uniref:Uncharacterized protein n=1 Tax=Spirodela intermedia TaxID=51605 RepID=A0A7I8KGP6_SPIIN|nr:unnamed protein product [Spirodela intermedia]
MAEEGHVEAVPIAAEQNGCTKAAVQGFVSFKPQLAVPAQKAEEAVLFYKEAFGAEEVNKVCCPKRKADQELPSLICAEIKIGSASVLVCDRNDDTDGLKTAGGGAVFRLETQDVKAAVSKAVKAGAVLEGELTEIDGPNGGISGKVTDPYGYVWIVASVGNACVTDA